MNAARFFCLLIAMVILTQSSCSRRNEPATTIEKIKDVNHKPMKIISETEAIALARTEFLKTGAKLEDYDLTVKNDLLEDRWIVLFDPNVRPSPPGGGYYVYVDKKTGKVILGATD